MKILNKLIVPMLLPLCFSISVGATEMTLYYDNEEHYYNEEDINLVINDEAITDLPIPIISLNDRSLVPVREIFEPLGATVDWKEANKSIYIAYGDNLIIMQIDNPEMQVNGEVQTLETPPKIINDKTMVPLRAVSENIGLTVNWVDDTRTIEIDGTVYNDADDSIDPNESSDLDTDENGNPLIIDDGDEDSDSIDEDNTNDDSDDNDNTDEDSNDSQELDDNHELGVAPEVIPEEPDESITHSDDVGTSNESINFGELIPYEDNATTTIDDIDYLNSSSGITISSTSPITSIDTFLLEDNRLIIDINNAKLGTTCDESDLDNINYSEVRLGQFQTSPEYITRAVIQLNNSDYAVNLSSDREEVIVSFEDNEISDIDYDDDVISITGNVAPNTATYIEGDDLYITMPGANLNTDIDEDVDGKYANSIKSESLDTGSQIVVGLNSQPLIITTQDGNTTNIKLADTTYKNISSNSLDDTIVIDKNAVNLDNMTVDDTGIVDKRIVVDLNKDYSDNLGYGRLDVNTSTVEYVTVETDGTTKLVFQMNEFGILDVTEDDDNYYISYVNPKEVYDKVVVIDAGHGAQDPGTNGNGLNEKTINLELATKLYDLLDADPDIQVYLTRFDDSYPSFEQRYDLANVTGDMLVSVHNNSASPNTEANGTETLYNDHSNDEELGFSSLDLANNMQDELIDELGSTDRGIKSRPNLILLNSTDIPSVILEVGFLSNTAEANNLKSDAYQQKAAQAMYDAIVKSFEDYDTSNNR